MNTLETPKLLDLHTMRREDVYNEENSISRLEQRIEARRNGIPQPPPIPADPDTPSELAIAEDEGFKIGEEAGKVVSWLTSPLMALGDAAAAPIAHNYEEEGLTGKLGEAFSVSGKALMSGLLPEYGEEKEDYGAQIVEKAAPNLSPNMKAAAATTVSMITDPTMAVGLPMFKSVQTGLRLKRMKRGQESTAGLIEEGLHEILTVGKGNKFDDLEGLGNIGVLAQKADKGDKKALKQLNTVLEDNPVIAKRVQEANDADTKSTLTNYNKVLGNPNAPTFVPDKTPIPKALLKESLTSNTTGRAGNINLSKVNSEKDLDNLLGNLEEVYGSDFDKVRGRTTHDMIIQDSQNEMLSDLMGRKAAEFTPKQSYALRQGLIDSGNQLVELSKRASLPEASALDMMAFEKGVAVHRSIQAKASGVARHAGQLLESHKIVAKGGGERIKEIRRMMGETKNNKKLLASLASATDDPQAINRFISKASVAKTTDAMYELFVNAVLSGPITHAVNVASNGLLVSLRPTQSIVEGMSSVARGDFTRARANMGQATAQTHAILQTTMDGLKHVTGFGTKGFDVPEDLIKAHELAKTQHKPAISAEALGAQGTMGQVIDALGSVVRFPGNMLLKEDKFFKTMHYRMEVNSTAAGKAMTSGGNSRDTRAVYNALRGNPDVTVKERAGDMASYYTFTSELGNTGSAVHKAIKATPGLRYLMPFFRTPTNIVKMGVRHSVFGNVFMDLKPALTDFTVKGDKARANIALGTAVPAAVLSMLDDNITGAIDQKSGAGQFKAQNGAPPYSIRIGSEWISYERMEPLRSVLGLYVNVKEALVNLPAEAEEGAAPDGMLEQVMGAVVGATTMTIGDNYMLPFLGDMVYMLEGISSGNPEYAKKKLNKIAASMLVPNFLRQVNSTYLDDSYRKADTFVDMVKQGIPGLSQSLPARKTFWGDDVHVPEGMGLDILSPLKTASVNTDEVDKEMIRIGVSIPGQPEKISVGQSGIALELTPEQQAQFSELRGKGIEGSPSLKEVFEEMFADPMYSYMPDEIKAERVKYIINKSTESTKKYMLATDESLQMQLKGIIDAREKLNQ